MTPSFAIERPGSDVTAELSAFAVTAFMATFGHIYSTEDSDSFLAEWNTPALLASQFADPDYAIALVRGADGAIAGFAKLGPIDFDLPDGHSADAAIELHQLYLAESAKGTGIADALMRWAIDEARARGNAILYLSVFTENPRAQAFYRRYGFVDIGRNPFRVGNHIDEDRIWRLDL
jgi:ribosomal protein S18 acetylase RimI-like enzyme